MRRGQVAYLNGLGIDVWIRRGAAVQDNDPGVPHGHVDVVPQPHADVVPITADTHREQAVASAAPLAAASDTQPQATATVVERLAIRCFRLGKAFVLISQDAWPSRRVLLDVARSLNGFRPANRRDLVFTWPQVESADASREALEKVFHAFLTHQVEQDDVVVAAGTVAAELATRDLGADVVDLPHVPMDGAGKRELWQRIQKLC